MRAILSAFIVGAAHALAAGSANCARAAIPPVPPQRVHSDKWPADRIEFVGSNARASAIYKIPDAPGLGTGDIAANATYTTANLSFGLSPRLSGSAHAGDPWTQVFLNYKLRPREVLPMLGAVYSVREITDNPTGVKLDRVTDAGLLKQIDVRPESTAIPLGCSAAFSLSNPAPELAGESLVEVKAVAAGGPNGGAPLARVSLSSTGYRTAQLPKETSVKEGDQIELMNHCRLRVVKIVGPDKDRGIAGWVEFSPDPPKKDKKPEKAPGK